MDLWSTTNIPRRGEGKDDYLPQAPLVEEGISTGVWRLRTSWEAGLWYAGIHSTERRLKGLGA